MPRFLIDLTMCFGRGRAEIHGGGEYGKAAARYCAAAFRSYEVIALVRAGGEAAAREELGTEVTLRPVGDGALESLPADLDLPENILFLPLPARFLERGQGCNARVVAVEHGLREHEKIYTVADHLCHPLVDGWIARGMLCGYAAHLRNRRLRRANARYGRRLAGLKEGDVLSAPSRHSRYALKLEFGAECGAPDDRFARSAGVLPPLAPFLSATDPAEEDAAAGILLLSANRPVKNVERFLEGLVRHRASRDAANRLGVDLLGTDAASRRRLERRFGSDLELRLHPYVAPERLQALIRDAFVLVFPSMSEGYGIPPVDAFRLGTPVIAAASTAVTEVTGGAALLADPLQPSEMANRVLQLADDQALYREKVDEGLSRYRQLRERTLDAWDRFVAAAEDGARQGSW